MLLQTGADRRGMPFLLTSFQAIVKRKARRHNLLSFNVAQPNPASTRDSMVTTSPSRRLGNTSGILGPLDTGARPEARLQRGCTPYQGETLGTERGV
jgi:hypothetical protein